MSKFKYLSGWVSAAGIGLMLLLAVAPGATGATEERRDVESIEMSVGRSSLVSAPWPVAKISVAEPAIADVQVAAPDQVVVLAKGIGRTDLVLWSEDGQSVTRVIDVHVDIAELQNDLSDLFPDARLTAGKSRDLVTIRGMFNRAEDAARLKSYMDTVGLKHLDMTSVAGVHQVLIKVRIAEASRRALRTLGVNAFYTGDDFFAGSIIEDLITFDLDTGLLGSSGALDTTINSGTTLFAGIPDADLSFFLRALEDNQYMRVLAEPSLIAASGEEASFLAGGEFPIPVTQGSAGGDSSTSITIEFKEFGIRLQFRPTVLGDGTIRIRVAPEVSQLSDVGAVELEGFRIPSLVTRRAETTLEMNSGQTFALAGLLNQETVAQAANTPGLGNVPVLGSLFRSVRYQNQETELVVLATVSLVEPLSIVADRPLPGDLHAPPSDWELYANGWIEGRVPAKAGEAHAAWVQEHGLSGLRGPGAWESYMGQPDPSGRMNAGALPASHGMNGDAESDSAAEAATDMAESDAPAEEASAEPAAEQSPQETR